MLERNPCSLRPIFSPMISTSQTFESKHMYIWGISITQSIIFLPTEMVQGILLGRSNRIYTFHLCFFYPPFFKGFYSMFRSIFYVLLALTFLPSIATAQTIDVYIMAGQSNMDGRGDVSDLSEEQLASLQNDTIIRYVNPGSERERAVPHPTRPILTSVPTVSQTWCLAALVSLLVQPGN